LTHLCHLSSNMGCCTSNYRLTAYDHLKGKDLSTKTFIVTGATAGIGLETARALASAKARVIILGRDQIKLDKVAHELAGGTKDWVIPMLCDNSSLSSVRDFAIHFRKLNLPIHGLILNAGISMTNYRLTKEGIDIQFGTNHVAHFLMTMLLLDILQASAPSRVVVVSSESHRGSHLDFSRLPRVREENYDRVEAYRQSKLANILFATEFNNRYASKGVTAYSLHPGIIGTMIGSEVPGHCIYHGCVGCLTACCLKNPSQGAATQVYCAVATHIEEDGGKYFKDSHTFELGPEAKNVDDMKKLWEWTEEITGLNKKSEEREEKKSK